MWIDFTRRNDPSTPFWVEHLKQKLDEEGAPPVLCFWTKAPATVAALFEAVIRDLQADGTLVLAQVTMNHFGPRLEPGVTPERADLAPLVELLGADHIRLRFDPIIPGLTNSAHFQECLRDAREYGIRRITLNWVETKYKDAKRVLSMGGREPTEDFKRRSVEVMLGRVRGSGVELAVCAESAGLIQEYPELKAAACADANWAIGLKPELREEMFRVRPSRVGCGCVYSGDWGMYASRGGLSCPHGCVYCYAK